jgi:hypothetical protein
MVAKKALNLRALVVGGFQMGTATTELSMLL